MFKLPDEVDHVLAHRAAVDLVEVATALVPRVLCLDLLHDLLPEAADLGRALNRHVLRALVSTNIIINNNNKYNENNNIDDINSFHVYKIIINAYKIIINA